MDFTGRFTPRRGFLIAVAATVLVGLLSACGGGGNDSSPVATWTAGLSDLNEDVSFAQPQPDATPISNRTIRQVSRIAVGGDGLRIKFSNLFGTSALNLTKVRVATSSGGGSIAASTDTAVAFSGAANVSIAPGQEVWTDPISMKVENGAAIAVSVYVQGSAPINTVHRLAAATRFEGAGDAASAPTLAAATVNPTVAYWVREIDVYRSDKPNVLVTFGDSITDGSGSTTNLNRRYPDALATRFFQSTSVPSVSTVNMGIGGNRWINDGYGIRGTERFKRDVLTVTGVTHALVLLGVNDIGFQFSFKPTQTVAAADLISAMSGAVAAGKAAGVKVYFGTLTPFKGASYYTPEGESIRQAVNNWIRTNTEAAGFVEFDKALQDATDPLRVRAELSRDNLHPNDTGYQIMADTVNLATFR